MDTSSGKTGSATGAEREELVISRVIDAPREEVWKEWTDPERVKNWWGPKGFTAPVIRMDFREGGSYLFCMRSPEGEDYWSTGTYLEIVPPERVVSTDSFADENGNVVPPTDYGMSPDFPRELRATVTFVEQENRTRINLRYTGFPAGEDRDSTRMGWDESLDKLVLDLERRKERAV